MSLFKKKEKEADNIPSLPSLPELPKLPELPSTESTEKDRQIYQLPSFPTNQFGEKFSQNTIKNAVTGEKEELEEDSADEFEEPNLQMMQPPLKLKPLTKAAEEILTAPKITKEAEPIFIRIDKFEESLRIFEQTKKQISEIETLLRETKELKQKEEQELINWEKEINELKIQIEKVDREIFSKVN